MLLGKSVVSSKYNTAMRILPMPTPRPFLDAKKLLEDTKLALQAKLREHDSISTPLDPQEISKAAESRRLIVEQIAEINKEQKQRETSLKATVHAYHEKRHTALQQKVEARRISMKQG